MSNKCTRCGNERIASKSWEEVIEIRGSTTTIRHQEFVCGDSKCQEIVEKQLLIQKEKRQMFENRKLEKQNKPKAHVGIRL